MSTWTKLSPNLPGRVFHCVSPLANGSAIATFGGLSGSDNDSTTTCDLFDPVNNVWVPGPSLPAGVSARQLHSQALLQDGRVLVCGGTNTSESKTSPATLVSDCWLYDPVANSWSRTGDLPAANLMFTADSVCVTLQDGRVLIVGGIGGDDVAVAATATWDPKTGVWTSQGNLNVGRNHYGTPVLLGNGKVLVCGGETMHNVTDITTWLSSCELFDPVTGTWSLTDPMPTPTAGPGLSGLEVAGGYVASALTGLPADWNARRFYPCCKSMLDGRALVTGGAGSFVPGATPRGRVSCLIYDDSKPAGSKWSQTGNMSVCATSHALRRLNDGRFIKMSGLNENLVTSIATEIYDPSTGVWTRSLDMPVGNSNPNSGTAAQPLFNGLEVSEYVVVLSDNRVVICYGESATATGHFASSASANSAVALFVP